MALDFRLWRNVHLSVARPFNRFVSRGFFATLLVQHSQIRESDALVSMPGIRFSLSVVVFWLICPGLAWFGVLARTER
jgi:hypothetical protein